MVTDDWQTYFVPSIARSGSHGVTNMGREGGETGIYHMENGESFTVGLNIDGEGTRFDNYPFSTMNRAVVHHALVQAGLRGKDVRLATGLPLDSYFLNNEMNVGIVNAKKENLAAAVTLPGGQSAAVVKDQVVVSEAVSAWIDYFIDQNGVQLEGRHWPAVVIDIGGRTTDIATIIDGETVDMKRSGTANIGVLDVYEALSDRICARFKLNSLSEHTVRAAFNDGKVRLYAEDHSVADEVAASMGFVQEGIRREINRRIGSGAEMEKILFVGGGANVFTDLSKQYPNAVHVPDPEFANARGMMKYMKFVAPQGAA